MRTMILAAAVALAGGCALNCTLMACEGFVDVAITGEVTGQLARFELVLDGEAAGCDLDVVTGEVTCDEGVTLEVVEGGFALARATGAEQPGEVRLRVEVDGSGFLDDAVEITWDAPSSPNGEQCGPTCYGGQGEAELTVPPA